MRTTNLSLNLFPHLTEKDFQLSEFKTGSVYTEENCEQASCIKARQRRVSIVKETLMDLSIDLGVVFFIMFFGYILLHL